MPKPSCCARRLSLYERGISLDKLFACAKAFEALLKVQYHITVGHRGKLTDLTLGFSKWDFHHLMGLGKLRELDLAKRNREKVFDQIIAGKIDYELLCKSVFLSEIENRFGPLAAIEEILDSNELVFRYLKKNNPASMINASFLLSTPYLGTDVYVFLAEKEQSGQFFCRFFFPRTGRDYTVNQKKYTLLYKEKRYLSTGETIVQYDRLHQER